MAVSVPDGKEPRFHIFILSRTSQTYARLSFSAGPGGSILLPVRVDWERWPNQLAGDSELLAAQMLHWQQEYAANVHVINSFGFGAHLSQPWGDELDLLAEDLAEEQSFEAYFEALAELRGDDSSERRATRCDVAKSARLDGIACLDNVPMIYFREVPKIDPDAVRALLRQFWNQGIAPGRTGPA